MKKELISILTNIPAIPVTSGFSVDCPKSVQIVDDTLYQDLLSYGIEALVSGFAAGKWTSPQLREVVEEFVISQRDCLAKIDGFKNKKSLFGSIFQPRASKLDLQPLLTTPPVIIDLMTCSDDFLGCGLFEKYNSSLEQSKEFLLKKLSTKIPKSGANIAILGDASFFKKSSLGDTLLFNNYARPFLRGDYSEMRRRNLFKEHDGLFDFIFGYNCVENIAEHNLDEFFEICASKLKKKGSITLQFAGANADFRLVDNFLYMPRTFYKADLLESFGEKHGLFLQTKQSLTEDFIKTLDCWFENLESLLNNKEFLSSVSKEISSNIRATLISICIARAFFNHRVLTMHQLSFVKAD